MGFGVVALVLTAAICAYDVHMSRLGRKADRERRHARFPLIALLARSLGCGFIRARAA